MEAMPTKKCPIFNDVDLFFHGPEYVIKVALKLPLGFRKIFALLSLFGYLNKYQYLTEVILWCHVLPSIY